ARVVIVYGLDPSPTVAEALYVGHLADVRRSKFEGFAVDKTADISNQVNNRDGAWVSFTPQIPTNKELAADVVFKLGKLQLFVLAFDDQAGRQERR
ncbi:MAG: hypothetical protein GTO14_10775, partial [Anaerolineales bacterium]|nr:hypothetical protein [Anaerolineales bacterium]